MKRLELPGQGFVFWPVGPGDSTTVLVGDDQVIQVDLNHLKDAEDDDDPRYPMIDELVELLPQRNGRPYLAAFVATHADADHCRGFRRLLEEKNVLVGELWFTPRLVADIDAEDPDSLSPDAKALRDEAMRRIEKYEEDRDPSSGDRLRVVGYHESLSDEFGNFDDAVVSVPGSAVTLLDGEDLADVLRVFIHTPFKDDMESPERNRTSIGLQVTLKAGTGLGRALLLGDLDYGPVKKLFEFSEDSEDKAWDVFLAPHHCSKSVMYEREDGSDILRTDVLALIEQAKAEHGWIVASSGPIPASNDFGDNPPHSLAKNRYSERCETFLCTGEHPDSQTPTPIIFAVTESGISFLGAAPDGASSAQEQVTDSRGGTQPAAAAVGFGCR